MKPLSAGVLLRLLTGAVGAVPERLPTAWRTYAGGPHRLFFHPAPRTVTAANGHQLQVPWTSPTGAVVTASPSIARLRLPGEGRLPMGWLQSWAGLL